MYRIMDWLLRHELVTLILALLGNIVIYGSIVYIVAHFISKYW
jgi:hypothetical protein